MEERKRKVTWSEIERTTVLKATVRKRLTEPSLTLHQCFLAAQQESLPADRSITIHASQLPWLTEGVAKELLAIQMKASQDVESIRDDYEKRLLETVAEAETMAQLSLEDMLEHAPIGQIVGALIDRAYRSQERLESAILSMSDRLDQLGAKVPVTEQTHKIVNSRFRIIVCGLLPEQFNVLKQRVQFEWLELIPIEAEHRGKLPNADVVVLWSKFISHKIQNIFLSQFHRNKILTIDSKKGLNCVIDTIRERAEWIQFVLQR